MKHQVFYANEEGQKLEPLDDFLNETLSSINPSLMVPSLGLDSPILGDMESSYDFSLAPLVPNGPPPRGDFPGEYNFQVFLNGETSHKKKYMYSVALNRVYLNSMAEMPVQFQWDFDSLACQTLFIRATLVFAGTEHQESRVLRCSIHKQPGDVTNRDIPSDILNHVLHSARQAPGVYYCGFVENEQSWLSVSFACPPNLSNGETAVHHVYKFGCKHSCISGINRRPIEILFTLENIEGTVLGRQSLGVRICSCPKRDLGKDEEEHRIKVVDQEPPAKKKRLHHSPAHQTQVNITSHLIHSLYHTSVVAAKQLPADNPAIPHIQNLIDELQKQINAEGIKK